jgi:hypothetical protein
MSEKVGHVSASSISSFKACPERYRLGYVEALRLAVEPQPLRFGTAWHRGLEILDAPVGTQIDVGGAHEVGTPISEENRLEIAIQEATQVYETIPDGQDPTDWAVEREVIANALAAYRWLYPDSQYEVAATELQFDLPLVNPETGHPTPNFRRVGKIDQVLRNKATGTLMIGEHKSTSRPIDSGSTYWDRLRKDTQSKFYICAARDLQLQEGPFAPGDSPVSGLLHDVFHKPSISPKMLTQADSKAFIETGEYCGQKFEVKKVVLPTAVSAEGITAMAFPIVDGVQAEGEAGKKGGTFALRETPGMYGARLLQDMTARPEFYFARREIAFTDAELEAFRYQIWALQKNMNEMERTGFWFENENQCEAAGSFKCPFLPICYNNVQCCDGKTVPPGFKRLHVEEAEQTETAGAE